MRVKLPLLRTRHIAPTRAPILRYGVAVLSISLALIPALLLSDVVDPGARHDAPTHQEASQPLVRTLYQLASRDGQDGARDQIAYIVSQFVSFQQLQRPFRRAFEEVAKIAAKLPESEEQAAALRTGFAAEGDGVVGPSRSELEERDWRADPSDGLRPVLEKRIALAQGTSK